MYYLVSSKADFTKISLFQLRAIKLTVCFLWCMLKKPIKGQYNKKSISTLRFSLGCQDSQHPCFLEQYLHLKTESYFTKVTQ